MKLYRYLKLSHNKLFKLQIKSVVEVIKSEVLYILLRLLYFVEILLYHSLKTN